MDLLLPSILITGVTVAAMVLLSTVVSRGAPCPATVDPFRTPADGTHMDDTMVANSSLVQTTKPVGTDWKVATLSDLGQVEALLDNLEVCGVGHSEVHVLTNNCFAVRWK